MAWLVDCGRSCRGTQGPMDAITGTGVSRVLTTVGVALAVLLVHVVVWRLALRFMKDRRLAEDLRTLPLARPSGGHARRPGAGASCCTAEAQHPRSSLPPADARARRGRCLAGDSPGARD